MADLQLLLPFFTNVGAALGLGIVLGLERQYGQHPAGLRTNSLVCVGSAMFVSVAGLLNPHAPDTARIAAYVVSGIGFLGGGVILREGFNVRGMNTAATLWGAGFPLQALVGAVIVLSIHLGLRPVAGWIDSMRKNAPNVEVLYQLRVVCSEQDQSVVRTILLRHVNATPQMTIQGITTQNSDQPGQVTVLTDISSMVRNDRALEEIVQRLNIEPSVSSITWEKRA
jgi:putative Mg2+ transporter-C (MgtC) family protein